MLFQVYFLSLLLEERDAGSLAEVADRCREKLIRRHPHVFGDASVETRRGRRAPVGRDQARGRARRRAVRPAAGEPAVALVRAQGPAPGGEETRPASEIVGDLFFQAVAVARALDVDPELALREAANRFKEEKEA